MICVADICVGIGILVIFSIVAVIVFLFVGIMIANVILRSLNTQDSEGIQTEITQTVPDPTLSGSGEPEEDEHPYQVGKNVYVGETESGLKAYLRLDEYDEEEGNLLVTALIEVPIAATNIHVDYELDDDFLLGRISIQYELGTEAVEETVYLENENLESSPYDVIISTVRGLKTNLTGEK